MHFGNRQLRSTRRRGQVMVEYTLVAGILLASVAVLAIFLYTFREYGDRVINLVASEYP